jgi:hypothetical protein
MTAYSFDSVPATGTINEGSKTIAVTVPFGTDVTILTASFTTIGASVSVDDRTGDQSDHEQLYEPVVFRRPTVRQFGLHGNGHCTLVTFW